MPVLTVDMHTYYIDASQNGYSLAANGSIASMQGLATSMKEKQKRGKGPTFRRELSCSFGTCTEVG